MSFNIIYIIRNYGSWAVAPHPAWKKGSFGAISSVGAARSLACENQEI